MKIHDFPSSLIDFHGKALKIRGFSRFPNFEGFVGNLGVNLIHTPSCVQAYLQPPDLSKCSWSEVPPGSVPCSCRGRNLDMELDAAGRRNPGIHGQPRVKRQ